jgi:hypothetical protein
VGSLRADRVGLGREHVQVIELAKSVHEIALAIDGFSFIAATALVVWFFK